MARGITGFGLKKPPIGNGQEPINIRHNVGADLRVCPDTGMKDSGEHTGSPLQNPEHK